MIDHNWGGILIKITCFLKTSIWTSVIDQDHHNHYSDHNHYPDYHCHLFFKDLNLNLWRREVAVEIETTLSNCNTFCTPDNNVDHNLNHNFEQNFGQNCDEKNDKIAGGVGLISWSEKWSLTNYHDDGRDNDKNEAVLHRPWALSSIVLPKISRLIDHC